MLQGVKLGMNTAEVMGRLQHQLVQPVSSDNLQRIAMIVVIIVMIEECIHDVGVQIAPRTLDDMIETDLEFHQVRLMDMTVGMKGVGVAALAQTGTAIELDGVEKRGE